MVKQNNLTTISLLLFPLVSILSIVLLNRDLDTTLVAGGAGRDGGEEVGDVVLG